MDKCREEFENWKKQEPQASNGYNAAMAWWHQQKRIDELQKSANEMDEYITKVQRCLPYYLLDQESDENWIGGVQNKISELEQKNDELQAQIDKSTLILEDMLKKGLIRSKYSLFDLEQALKGGEV